MRSMSRLAALLLSLLLVAAACSGDDDADSTTTTGAAGGVDATLADTPTGDDAEDNGENGTTTTTIDLGEPDIPEFEIVATEEGDEGDTVVVLLDDTSYERLTDIDIQNVVAQVIDDFGVYAAHVIDDERLAEVVLDPSEADDAEEQLLETSYLAELDEGFRLTFRGPFSDEGSVVIGS